MARLACAARAGAKQPGHKWIPRQVIWGSELPGSRSHTVRKLRQDSSCWASTALKQTRRAGGGEADLPRPLFLSPIQPAGWSKEGPRDPGWS